MESKASDGNISTSQPPMTVEEARQKREAWHVTEEDTLDPTPVSLPEPVGIAFSHWIQQVIEPLQALKLDDPEFDKIRTTADQLTAAERITIAPLEDGHGWTFQPEGTRTQPPDLSPTEQPIELNEAASRRLLRAMNDTFRNPLSLIAGFAELQAVRGTDPTVKEKNTVIKDVAFTAGNTLQEIAKNDYTLSFAVKADGMVSITPHPRPVYPTTP